MSKEFTRRNKIDVLQRNPFLDGPTEYLVKTVVRELKKYKVWTSLFGDFMDPYKRMDYSMRNFPAMRIYNDGYIKPHESWFIDGDLTVDLIWPPGIRRTELQQIPDTVAAAVVQQFRRPSFFDAVEFAINTDENAVEDDGFRTVGVPGLNELGKRVTVDKSLAYDLGNDQYAPLTQLEVNFRVDLREWDDYLEEQNRTKDEPFVQTLGDLERIAGRIVGVNDDGEFVTDIGSIQTDQFLEE